MHIIHCRACLYQDAAYLSTCILLLRLRLQQAGEFLPICMAVRSLMRRLRQAECATCSLLSIACIHLTPQHVTLHDTVENNVHLVASVLKTQEDFKLFVTCWLDVQAGLDERFINVEFTTWDEFEPIAECKQLDTGDAISL